MKTIWTVAVVVSAAFSVPAVAAEVRAGPTSHPLVGEMHENLATVNQILEDLARRDLSQVQTLAARLGDTGRALESLDLGSIGLDPGFDAGFDRFARAQVEASKEIARAGKIGDAPGVVLGIRNLYDQACLACHAKFRSTYTARTPPVLFMRVMSSAMQSINRGLATGDLSLVAREAREVGVMARILTWPQVVDSLFGISDARMQEGFRDYLNRLIAEASRVEGQALERTSADLTEGVRRMWTEGCLACHDRFYPTEKQ